jgi:hypothetical protein
MCGIAGWVSYDGDLRAERDSKTRRNVHDPAPSVYSNDGQFNGTYFSRFADQEKLEK